MFENACRVPTCHRQVWGWFRGDRVWYAGEVRRTDDGATYVHFDDGDEDRIIAGREWRLIEEGPKAA